jgi:hypothetical protein
MPISANDLIPYLAENNPDDDVSTGGGGIETLGRPTFTQWTANAVVAVVSDGTDTRTLNVEGRSPTGSIVTDAIVLNGTTEAVGTVTFERILKLSLSTTDASRTVTIRQGAGGPTRATIDPNERFRFAHFKRSASEATTVTRYDKLHWKNTHATLTLQNAKVQLAADPDARIRQGIHTSKNDTVTIANRKTAPPGITFVDDTVDQDVPGTTLEAGSSIGVWYEQTLPANDPAHRTTYTSQITGQTV